MALNGKTSHLLKFLMLKKHGTTAKPDPDERIGGIVKLATVGQVEEGTNKCDPVTPYTLKEGFTDNISDKP